MTIKKKVVGYSRFSSINQSDSSTILTQQNAIEEYCSNNNMILLSHYVDLALSGREAEHRIQFQEMIQDIKEGGIDAVIVYTRDRFSRSIKDFLKYLEIMEKYNCELICVNGNHSNPDSPSGKLSEWVIMSIAQYYVENLSRESLRGLRYNAQHGLWNTIAPLGYKLNNQTKKLEIDPYESKAIIYMFNSFIEGTSQTNIAKNLNEMGYRTRRGNLFTKSIKNYLANRVYIGEYNYHIYKSENQQHIVIADAIPRIIDDNTFNQVQEILNKNKKEIIHKPITLLKGKVFCGYTNYSLSYHLSRKDVYGEVYYYDSKVKSRNGIKSCKKINADTLNDLIKLLVYDIIINVQNVPKLFHLMKNYINEYRVYLETLLEGYKKQYIDNKIELSNIIQLLSSGQIDGSNAINEAINTISKLNDHILSLEANISLNESRLSEFENVRYRELQSQMAIIRQKYEVDFVSTILEIIDKVILYDNSISVFINTETFIPQLRKIRDSNIKLLQVDIDRETLEEFIDNLCIGEIKFEDLDIRSVINER